MFCFWPIWYCIPGPAGAEHSLFSSFPVCGLLSSKIIWYVWLARGQPHRSFGCCPNLWTSTGTHARWGTASHALRLLPPTLQLLSNLRVTIFWETVFWLIFRFWTLNHIFRSRVGPQSSGILFWAYSIRYGSMWTKFQLRPSNQEPNHYIYANYSYWGGGQRALSLGCCQKMRPKSRWLVQPARDRLLKDCLLRDVKSQSFKRRSRAGWILIDKKQYWCVLLNTLRATRQFETPTRRKLRSYELRELRVWIGMDSGRHKLISQQICF